MTLDEELDALRDGTADCRAAAYIDIEAELVLTASTASVLRRETLDRLAEEARRLFAPSALTKDSPPPDLAVLKVADGLHVFVRAAQEPGEALCCLCTDQADPDRVAAAARRSLMRILADE